MKLSLKHIGLFLFCLLSIYYGNAQNDVSKSSNNLNDEVGIPPLQVVLDSVLKKNAMLKFRKHHIEVKATTLKSERTYWIQLLSYAICSIAY